MLRSLPPGTLPPEIINFSASSVPVLQLGLSGQGLSEQQLNDASQNYVRPQLITVPGAVVPNPYGGKQRQIMINMDQQLMQEKGVSAHRRAQCGECAESGDPLRHREDRPEGIRRAHQRRRPEPRGHQQHPDQAGRRHDDLCARCRHGQRRLCGADQCRAAGWPPQRAGEHPEKRARLHARCRRRRAQTAAAHRRDRAAGTEDDARSRISRSSSAARSARWCAKR